MTSGFCNRTLPRSPKYDPHLRCPGCDCLAPGCPCGDSNRADAEKMTPEEAMEALL